MFITALYRRGQGIATVLQHTSQPGASATLCSCTYRPRVENTPPLLLRVLLLLLLLLQLLQPSSESLRLRRFISDLGEIGSNVVSVVP